MGIRKIGGIFMAAVTGTATAGASAALGVGAALWGREGFSRLTNAGDPFDASMHIAGGIATAALAIQAAQVSGGLFRYIRSRVSGPA